MDDLLSKKLESLHRNALSLMNSFTDGLSDEHLKSLHQTVTQSDNKFGYLYYLLNEDTGLVKIGMTMNLEKRMKSIVSSFKNTIGITPNLKLLQLIVVHKSLLSTIEADFHKSFSEYRKYGEWFDMSNNGVLSDIYCGNYEEVEDIPIVIDDTYEFHLYDSVKIDRDLNYIQIKKAFAGGLSLDEKLSFENKSNKVLDILSYFNANRNRIKTQMGQTMLIGFGEDVISLNGIKLKWLNNNKEVIKRAKSILTR